jgi:uncharacterized protein with von Willebrand factor type A (vWA) domain
MVIARYTKWDGSQRVRLTADEIFAKLSEFLSTTDDVQQAMDWLMRQGLEQEEEKIKGLDDLVRELREEMRQRYRESNLRSALDEPRQRLNDIVDQEKETLERLRPHKPGMEEKQNFLKRLPPRLSDAMEKLSRYEFEDQDAEEQFRELLEELSNIRSLEDFQRRYGELFNGPRSLSYEEALELMREMERLKELEESLLSGHMENVDPQELRDLMGQGAWQDFEDLQEMRALVEKAGLVIQREGRLKLSPKGVRRIGQLALRDIYQKLLRDRAGSHPADHRGIAEIRVETTKPYQYGDPMHLDLVGTLKRALLRGAGTPLNLQPDDFLVFDSDHTTTTSTVLLLDMSWSMSWEGRFAAAKKVALALESLIRTRYPRDYLGMVGFFTRAVELKVKDLPEASWNMGDPFTNLQDGLRLAADLLHRHPSQNQQMIVVTDGQPTAYFSRGRLYCEWPLSFGGISMRAAQETLRETEKVTRKGITINTFMLDDSPSLKTFVDRMTQINRGRAFYTRPDRLGEYMLVDYLAKKRKKV